MEKDQSEKWNEYQKKLSTNGKNSYPANDAEKEWRASKEKVKSVEYVFGVYNSLIVAVYKPSEWLVCKEAKDRLPRQDIVLTPKTENRLFFVDERYEQGLPLDENEEFYLGKSIAGLKFNQSA